MKRIFYRKDLDTLYCLQPGNNVLDTNGLVSFLCISENKLSDIKGNTWTNHTASLIYEDKETPLPPIYYGGGIIRCKPGGYADSTCSSVPAGTTEKTIEFWIYPHEKLTKFGSIYGFGDNVVNGYFLIYASDNDQTILSYGAVDHGATSPAPNQWHHIAATYDKDKIGRMFFDGKCVTTITEKSLNLRGNMIKLGHNASSGGVINQCDFSITNALIYNYCKYTTDFNPTV